MQQRCGWPLNLQSGYREQVLAWLVKVRSKVLKHRYPLAIPKSNALLRFQNFKKLGTIIAWLVRVRLFRDAGYDGLGAGTLV